MNFKLPIILIGPMASGKSTVADELSKQLNVPRIPMDRIRWYYYFKDGFSMAEESSRKNFTERMLYWKPFEVSAVRNVTVEFPNSIIDFGAGHSYFPDENHFHSVQSYLSGIQNIFLLLPSEDKIESLKICNERLKIREERDLDEHQINANRQFIEHPSSYRLAKHIIYTQNETAKETTAKIIQLLK